NHLGAPGLGITCASGGALDGFCDSLAYEVAPFNIKVSIVQPNMEVNVLASKITVAPLLKQYDPGRNSAPSCRDIMSGLLDRIEASMNGKKQQRFGSLKSEEVVTTYPKLPTGMKKALLAEIVHAITAIGGHSYPPARHIVGSEGVASVEGKLKTMSEEMEDFAGVSYAVDFESKSHDNVQRSGQKDSEQCG
ncbi:MAG: hypothetical protein Q9164_001013, partial [Protoblastenia rupestris]